MKFKLIFLLFNILILLSFGIVIIMPVMILGTDYSINLWSNTWYLPALFILIIIAIDGYFFMNWQLFSLLESENWAELLGFLEEKVLQKECVRVSYVRTYIQTCLVTGQVRKIEALESLLRKKRPGLLRKFALELGMPKVLHKDHADMVSFYSEFTDQRVPRREWVRFLHAFGMLMQQEHSDGREKLLSLSKTVKEPLLKVLVLYTLEPFRAVDSEVLEQVDQQKSEMRNSRTKLQFEKDLSRRKDNVAMVVMTPLIKDAIAWLFAYDEG